ncbi:hypothetical protein HW561_01030 [Rhodobacteraceae bacterium B1Z28]|uniref:Uncharacterized protein n=1 Tax=Ruegeria haliotis TaxID=2747601 RepID=A0ABX2PJU8_9RHOB|nr:hypothetical protein [Ruegeria haliotis]NVO54371.1 hypothetical protein [Ruegeria haliotis]
MSDNPGSGAAEKPLEYSLASTLPPKLGNLTVIRYQTRLGAQIVLDAANTQHTPGVEDTIEDKERALHFRNPI